MARRTIYLTISIVAIGLVIICVKVFHQPEGSAANPDVSPLAKNLAQTAEQAIVAPKLSDSSLTLSVIKGDVAREVQRIDELAERFGGSATQGLQTPGASPGQPGSLGADIIAQIPTENTRLFLQAAKDPAKPLPDRSPSNGAPTSWIEIKILIRP